MKINFSIFAQRNDFEQFSINFANEKLQAFFNDYIFKYEQSDYLEEGIKWSNVDFIDNSECLSLFALVKQTSKPERKKQTTNPTTNYSLISLPRNSLA